MVLGLLPSHGFGWLFDSGLSVDVDLRPAFRGSALPAVTLRQIAERAKCTRATVSYALKNAPGISAETKQRIRAIAEQLGWKPDPELSRQMALTRGTVGRMFRCNLAILVQKPAAELETDPIPRAHFQGACRRAEQLGFTPTVINLAEERLAARRLKSILHSRNVRGIVFIATVGSLFTREYLSVGRDAASAVIGVRYPEIGFHVAMTDFLANGLIALQAMRERGYRRVAAVLPRGVDGPLDWSFGAALTAGHLKHYGSRDLPLFYGGPDEIRLTERDRKPLLAWLGKVRPDVVLTSDTYNFSRLTEGHAAGVLPVYSLNYVPGPGQGLGGIDQRYEMAGAAGVDLVVAQLHRDERGVPEVQKSVQIAGTWIWAQQ